MEQLAKNKNAIKNMRTVLFNLDTNQTTGPIRNGYYTIDGVRPQLEDNIVELILTEQSEPSYNPDTQRIEYLWIADVENKSYTKTWSVIDLTESELQFIQNEKNWPERDYLMRIKISFYQINMDEYVQEFTSKLVLWWTLTGLPHRVDSEYSYFYCDYILPEHQSIIDLYDELIEIENTPWPQDSTGITGN